MLARTTLICKQACVSSCWENSKYISICVKVDEIQCLCEDAEFQSVLILAMPPFSISRALLMDSRWFSNVFTLNARLLNLAPPSTKPSLLALMLGWIPSMHRLLLSVTKVYESAEARSAAMHQAMSLHLLFTLWLVVLLAGRYTSVPVRHAALVTFFRTRMTCRRHYQWSFPHLQPVPKSISQQPGLLRMAGQNTLQCAEKVIRYENLNANHQVLLGI